MKHKLAAITLVAATLLAGDHTSSNVIQYYQRQPLDLSRPPADVPFDLRVKNYWGGSCYHASTQVALRWADQGAIADNWRNTYGHGASTSDIARVLEHYKIPYKRTNIKGYGPNEDGTEEFLDYAHNHRLVAAIHYYPGHAISFLGWCKKGDKEYACLLDNNRINDFIFVEKKEFLWNWQNRYHAGAIIPLVKAPPPIPYNPYDHIVENDDE